MNNRVAFGKRLRNYRKTFGFSQESFAEIIDVSIDTVSRFERGKRFPAPEVLAKIVRVLDVNYDDLLTEKNPLIEDENKTIKIINAELNTLSEAELEMFLAYIRTYKKLKKDLSK